MMCRDPHNHEYKALFPDGARCIHCKWYFTYGEWRDWEIEELNDRIDTMEEYLNEFCDRVEFGEIRSRVTYAKFCELLERVNTQEEET